MKRLLWFLIGFTLSGLAVVGCDAYAQSYPVWEGRRTYPGNIYLRGPNNLPFNVDTGRFVSIGPASAGSGGSAGASLNGSYNARINNLPLTIDAKRDVPPNQLARLGKNMLRAAGPVGAITLGLTLVDYLWDDETDQWTIPEEPDLGDYPLRPGTWSCSLQRGCTLQEAMQLQEEWLFSTYPNGVIISWTEQSSTSWRFQYRITPQGGGNSRYIYKESPECPTGYNLRYLPEGDTCVPNSVLYRPATEQEIEDSILDDITARGYGPELAKRLIENGYDLTPSATSIEASGPSTIDAGTETTTTTGPAGTTTRNTSTTYELGYQGDTVDITERKTTTTTHPDGSTSTEEHTRQPNPGSGIPPPPDEEQPPSLCEEFPDISACQELGEPEEDFELPEEEFDIDWDQTLSAAGSCPAPLSGTVAGYSYEFSYEHICTFASSIRGLVIALAWLSAGIWLFMFMRVRQ